MIEFLFMGIRQLFFRFGISCFLLASFLSAQRINLVMQNDSKIFGLIGRYPRFFRLGAAYYDDVVLLMLRDTGYIVVGYDVSGDGGATFSKDQMIKQADLVRNGSILIYHLNHPEKAIYDGLREVVKILQARGFVFKKLDDFL